MMETSVPVPFGPDFLCIGMGKAGTGWLYDSLKRHPDFWLPPFKEIRYLDRDVPKTSRAQQKIKKSESRLNKARAAQGKRPYDERDFAFVRDVYAASGKPLDYQVYGNFFRHKQGQMSGDVTPGYGTMTDERIAAVMKAFPKLKVILLVRDPISRAWSHFCMKLRRDLVDKTDLLKPEGMRTLLGKPNSGANDRPSQIARNWARHVPQGQFRSFFLDDIQTEPDRVIREILEFLGADLGKPAEPAGNRKAEMAKIALPDDIRAVLIGHFADELRQCADYFGGPAVGWLQKYGLARA